MAELEFSTPVEEKTVDASKFNELLKQYKSLVEKVSHLNNEKTKSQQKLNMAVQKGVKLREELHMVESNPGIRNKMQEMNYELKMAEQFINSGAFPDMKPEQAFTIIQAGKEMGMAPMESMKSLYVVKGAVCFHGSGMLARLTKAGYKVRYYDESEDGVTVHVSHEDGFDAYEVVTRNDQILQKSKAMTFAAKNKMRWHGIRMILNFYLPHLIGSTNGWDVQDYPDIDKMINQDDLASFNHLQYAESLLEKSQLPAVLHQDFSDKLNARGLTTKEVNQMIETMKEYLPNEYSHFRETGFAQTGAIGAVDGPIDKAIKFAIDKDRFMEEE